jgi:hypothetical protein
MRITVQSWDNIRAMVCGRRRRVLRAAALHAQIRSSVEPHLQGAIFNALQASLTFSIVAIVFW